MNRFEVGIRRYLGAEELVKLRQVCIGIAGAGGLGSNCALMLVRCGFNRLTLADMDRVEPSNLNRQFFFLDQVGGWKVDMLRDNLLAVNPDLTLTLYRERLHPGNVRRLLADCQVIVEALDTAGDKKMMLEAFVNTEKLLVCASGISGWGNSDALTVHRIGTNVHVVGDLVSEAGDDFPPVAPRVTLAAAKQADIILTHVLGKRFKPVKE
ncbi:MAG: sulfur carrier protein ThiS adenylyltransferase ThiF [Thermodesulfobacteriota bacterium]